MVIIAQNLLFFNHVHKKFTIVKLQIYPDFHLTEIEKHIIIKKYHTEYDRKEDGMKKIISFVISMVMAVGMLIYAPSKGILQVHAGKSIEEVTQQITETYQAIYAGNGYSSFSGMCGMFVRCSVEQRGLTSSWELSGNGNQWYPRMTQLHQTSKGYYIETFAGTNCLEQLVEAHQGRNLYDIVVGFSQGISSSGKLYGHVLYIHAIINGIIYYCESFNSSGLGAKEGGVLRKTIPEFKNYYLGSGCVFAGAGHFYKEDEEEEEVFSNNTLVPAKITRYNGHIYARYDNLTDYAQAEELCQKMGGHLAVLDTKEEYQEASVLLTDISEKSYWLGRTDDPAETVPLWRTEGAPDNAENRKNGFILEIEPIYYVKMEEYQNHLYCLFEDTLNWIEAEEYCEMLGGYLVTVSDSEENAFIQSFIQSGEKNDYWIGLYDPEKTYTYQWITGEALTLEDKWGDNQPDCYENTEFYCEMYKDSGCWNDRIAYSDGAVGFICEIPICDEGDINHDGVVNEEDIILLQKYLLNSEKFSLDQFRAADLNGDGEVNVFDNIVLKRNVLQQSHREIS